MIVDLKKIPIINTFIMLLTGDRLGNKALMENMKLLEMFCGGRAVWENIIIVITKQDFNPYNYEEDEWKESLDKIENECRDII